MDQPVPVHILAGFLGSGKTTLLNRALDYYAERGLKPAVLMNEIGDVNLDGMLVAESVPMTEMLSGCICCTIRGDLGLEIRNLVVEHKPDVIFIESTGVANPIEILDGVTDASLLDRIELKSVVTVVDAAHLDGQLNAGSGKTLRLMRDQIRCASYIVLNKIDLVPPSQLQALNEQIRDWNEFAPIDTTVKCQIAADLFDTFDRSAAIEAAGHAASGPEGHGDGAQASAGPDSSECGCAHHDADRPERSASCEHHQDDDHARSSHVGHDHSGEGHAAGHHHTHDHVMAYTHYFDGPIDSLRFEELLSRLPQEVYRAKGIVRFTDAPSRFMFQFAYREADFMKIEPKEDVPDVAVFIGEHFSRDELRLKLLDLQSASSTDHV